MAFDQTFKLTYPMRHGHAAGHKALHIHKRFGLTFRVIEIRHTAGHARAEVRTDIPKDHCNTAGHVFTTVGATPFDNDLRTRIAHGKPFTSAPSCKEIPIRRTVKHGVTDDGVLRSDQRRHHGWAYHNRSARQTLADIVIGIA